MVCGCVKRPRACWRRRRSSGARRGCCSGSIALFLAGFLAVTWRSPATRSPLVALAGGRGVGAPALWYARRKARSASRQLRGAVPGLPGIRFALHARRTCLFGGHRNGVPRIQRPAGGRTAPRLRGAEPRAAARYRTAQALPARAFDGRAVLRFRRAAAKAHRRQSGGGAGQAGATDSRTLQAARANPRGRARRG